MIVSPFSLTVTENQTATFYCSAYGNPNPILSWRKINGAELMNADGHHQRNKLQIKLAVYNDSGKYVCTASNLLGQAEKEVKLFVEGRMFSIDFTCGGGAGGGGGTRNSFGRWEETGLEVSFLRCRVVLLLEK